MLLRMGPAAERRLKARLVEFRRLVATGRRAALRWPSSAPAIRVCWPTIGGRMRASAGSHRPAPASTASIQYRCSEHASLESIVAFYLADQRPSGTAGGCDRHCDDLSMPIA
jgi:hypothetical protein